IPRAEAEWLAEQRREFFDVVGYPVDPDLALEPLQADLNWIQLQLNSTREHLGLERSKHRTRIAETTELRHQLQLAQRSSADQETAYRETHAELIRYRDTYLETRDQLIGKQRELDATIQRLDAIYQAHESTYQRLDTTYLE